MPVASRAAAVHRHAGPGEPPTAVVLALCLLALAPTLTYRMGTDQGVFAYMGAAYMEAVHGVERARVGLLSVGEEPKKGTEQVVEANRLLSEPYRAPWKL